MLVDVTNDLFENPIFKINVITALVVCIVAFTILFILIHHKD